MAWIASVAQFGYATGLLFFAPLGDRVNRRPLVAALSVATTAALLAGAAAPGTAALAVAVFVAAAATVVPQPSSRWSPNAPPPTTAPVMSRRS